MVVYRRNCTSYEYTSESESESSDYSDIDNEIKKLEKKRDYKKNKNGLKAAKALRKAERIRLSEERATSNIIADNKFELETKMTLKETKLSLTMNTYKLKHPTFIIQSDSICLTLDLSENRILKVYENLKYNIEESIERSEYRKATKYRLEQIASKEYLNYAFDYKFIVAHWSFELSIYSHDNRYWLSITYQIAANAKVLISIDENTANTFYEQFKLLIGSLVQSEESIKIKEHMETRFEPTNTWL
jgi:hypothetical protein